MAKVYCKYCGIAFSSVQSLTSTTCSRHPDGVGKGEEFKLPRRPTYGEIAEHIKVFTNGTQTPNLSTVQRTILPSTNPKLKLLWKNIGDVTFVRDYRRKKKQPRKHRSETDEDFIEGMFSEVGMEQDHDGFHVV